MHTTDAGEKRKALKREAREMARQAKAVQKAGIFGATQAINRLQEGADKARAESEALKDQARLEDLHLWQMKKVKTTKKGSRAYTYWMATWREGGKTRNVHLGSSRKMDAHAALQKARGMKAEALG